MEFLSEKIAYLRGLAEGLEVTEDTKEGKLFSAIIDVLQEMSNDIEELYDEQDEVDEYLDLIDQDLSKLEDEVFCEFEDNDFDFDEDDFEDYACSECDAEECE